METSKVKHGTRYRFPDPKVRLDPRTALKIGRAVIILKCKAEKTLEGKTNWVRFERRKA